ncbi:ABC transporter substrate-binding protein [Lactobacillus psittaci]|uniref:Spermidine putrescine-binding periplasmic protein n=1 Tax=Lactobacillus psittaci DSM 15354 TaxID=1122152 RepID=A0A0R1SBI1_9LACO|nr:ABC transporter substrate-binding protein [Lactobacillus psittaci]KRL63922.1 spermidine putrescine-binding periplasmic protein [Lactobacillus psittaci DSM 15354]
MKKLVSGAILILLVCLGLSFAANKLDSSSVSASNKSLIIYNWGDYIDPKLISKFEKETGYKVIYETFDSNEAMYTKIKQGGTSYDLAIPSDYMITKMRKSHLLDKIDTSKLSNFKYLNSRFLHQSFDSKNQYSVPYFWGTLGIVYNDKFVKPGEIEHWNDLWKSKWHNNILLVDSARDIMGLSLASMDYSMNTTNSVELKLAKTKLDALGTNVKAIISDEMKMYMIQNEAAIGVTWSGEASEMLSNNKHLHYIVPSEGSNLWFDNLVMPKTAKNKKAAYAFINFMLNPKNAAQNAEYVGYATPNKAALKYLPKDVINDKQFYPDDKTLSHLQVYRDLDQKKVQEYNDLFLEFKMYSR